MWSTVPLALPAGKRRLDCPDQAGLLAQAMDAQKWAPDFCTTCSQHRRQCPWLSADDTGPLSAMRLHISVNRSGVCIALVKVVKATPQRSKLQLGFKTPQSSQGEKQDFRINLSSFCAVGQGTAGP